MSMTLTNAKLYISRVIGAQNESDIQTQSGDALAQAMEKFQQVHDWTFTLLDTAQTFTVTGGDTASNTPLITSVTNGFKDVLVGMTVDDDGTDIPAGTTVASIESNTSLTMSAAAIGTTPSTVVFTFGGTIPIISGTSSYNLPAKFYAPYSCRLLTNVTRPLNYTTHYNYDRLTADQTVQRAITHYTIYNGATFDATGTQQTKIKFLGVPDANDTALLKYYRELDPTTTTVDCHDHYLYILLNMSRVALMYEKNTTDRRLPMWERKVERDLYEAIKRDRRGGGVDQTDRFISPNEGRGSSEWDGNFWPQSDSPSY